MPECHTCPNCGQYDGIPYHLTPCSKCLDRPLTTREKSKGVRRWTGDQPAHQGRSHLSLDAGDEQTQAECEATSEHAEVDTTPLPVTQSVMDALAFFLRMDPADRDLLSWRMVNPREPLTVYARQIGAKKQTVSHRLKKIVSASKVLHDVVYPGKR